MRTIRLFLNALLGAGSRLALPEDRAHYLRQVLRLRPGDELWVFNGDGMDYRAQVTRTARHHVELALGSPRPGLPEPHLQVTLGLGISKGERMDLAVQKCVELGVARISPLVSDFTQVRLSPERAGQRVRHWQGVAASACEQSGRARVPAIDAPRALQAWLPEHEGDRLVLVPGSTVPMGGETVSGNTLTLLVGPEGGLSETEVRAAQGAGFRGVSLGPRVLRTETAALACVTAAQLLWGDLGTPGA